MTEYITKEQALEAVTRNLSLYGDEWMAAYNIVGAIPPADVAPVVHARWEACKVGPMNAYACSNCGLVVIERNIPMLKYCHQCGARMDGGDKPQKEIPEEYSREPGAGGWDCSDEEYNYSGYVRDVLNGGW